MELSEALPGAVKQVFGEMFFTFVSEAARGGDGEGKPFAVESEIGFKGDRSGRMRLVFSQRLAEQLAANLVGVDPAVLNEGEIIDAVKEAANILCCNLLMQAGVQTSEVSIPVARPFEAATAEAEGDTFEFEAEGEPLRVVIRLEDA